jgi:hypothetical protein
MPCLIWISALTDKSVLLWLRRIFILGFTAFGVGAGEVMSSVQIAMIAGLPYTALRDAILAHPTLTEGLGMLFSSAPSLQSTGS